MAAVALHEGVVGGVDQVDGHGLGRVGHVVGGVEGADVLVAGADGVLTDVGAANREEFDVTDELDNFCSCVFALRYIFGLIEMLSKSN